MALRVMMWMNVQMGNTTAPLTLSVTMIKMEVSGVSVFLVLSTRMLLMELSVLVKNIYMF